MGKLTLLCLFWGVQEVTTYNYMRNCSINAIVKAKIYAYVDAL